MVVRLFWCVDEILVFLVISLFWTIHIPVKACKLTAMCLSFVSSFRLWSTVYILSISQWEIQILMVYVWYWWVMHREFIRLYVCCLLISSLFVLVSLHFAWWFIVADKWYCCRCWRSVSNVSSTYHLFSNRALVCVSWIDLMSYPIYVSWIILIVFCIISFIILNWKEHVLRLY